MDSTDRPAWRSRVWPGAGALLVVLVLLLLTVGGTGPAATVVPLLLAAGAGAVLIWALSRTRRHRREYEHRLTAWAGERAAHAERLRVARELHDLVSHGLGLVTVRAAAAGRMPGPDGDRERADALADIERVARETTTELRRMLAVLRTPGDDPLPLLPAATLADLPAIVAAAAGAGLSATLDVADLGVVSPGGQLAVCAVVREGLGNAARHAGPTRVRVTVRRDGAALVVGVQDDGPRDGWTSRPGAGHGLTGLRERVTALGGTLLAGPAGPGFRLTARLPDGPAR
ncbi:sensor histidine kinase [Micromonospora zhanjiangensis]|uniref:histidine kinase n=1 Tax=Micromonospora zhanjiangensis TaxID=1522057 RepID=A0ABV8KI67_9ACTN